MLNSTRWICTFLLAAGWNTVALGDEKKPEPARPLRVLLFADAPTREYHFVRTLLLREPEKFHVRIVLQSAGEPCDQGVEPEFLSKQFTSPRDVDLILAFDPDWEKVSTKKLRLLQTWVSESGGGLVVVAGPVNSFRLARPGGRDLTPLLDMLPARLADNRLHGVRPLDSPFALRLSPEGNALLKLDKGDKAASACWDKYFWNGEAPRDAKARPARGFHSSFPVKSMHPDAQVLASVVTGNAREQPFLLAREHGKGRVLLLTSGELWRLRAYECDYHQRLWGNLADYAAGRLALPYASRLYVPAQTVEGGKLRIAVRLVNDKGEPLEAGAARYVRITPPLASKQAAFEVELKAKKGGVKSAGWFEVGWSPTAPGEHGLTVDVPDTKTILSTVVLVQSQFQALIDDQGLVLQQRELARRSADWSESALKYSKSIGSDKAFAQEAKVYQEIVDAMATEYLAARHVKVIGKLDAVKGKKLVEYDAALEESKSLSQKLQQFRERLLGGGKGAMPSDILDRLRTFSQEEETLEASLDKGRSRLVAAAALCKIDKKAGDLSAEERQNLAARLEETVKDLRAVHTLLQDDSRRYRKALQDLTESKLRADTFRFLEVKSAKPIEQFLMQDFDRLTVTLRDVHQAAQDNKLDQALIAKAQAELTKASAALDKITVLRTGPFFLELFQIEIDQAQQTRHLTDLKKRLEADLLKKLLEG